VGKVPIEEEVLSELENLVRLVQKMISGESLKAAPLAEFLESYGQADLASIFDNGQEFIFISSEGDDKLDNYIEIRSTLFPEMAITLPRPAFTRMGESSPMSAESLAKWREDLC
jgi:hypothetical protein